MAFAAGDSVFALNPKYSDGTRLREGPARDAAFNGVWVPNDTKLLVTAVDEGHCFAHVSKENGQTGWIQARNITHVQRKVGAPHHSAVHMDVVTPDPEYVRGVKIWGVGILQDPVPGEKRGKGAQHLISPQWELAMAEFAAAHLSEFRGFVKRATVASEGTSPSLFFANCAHALFNQAIVHGLHSLAALNKWLMCTWLVMASSETDEFPFEKYGEDERAVQRASFFATHLGATAAHKPPLGSTPTSAASSLGDLGEFDVPMARRDLLPPIAMERLGINNELSALKYADPGRELREGFEISRRLASTRRHFESVFAGKTDEDHITHLLWNLMAIFHVATVFPHLNDLPDYPQGPSHSSAAPSPSPSTGPAVAMATHAKGKSAEGPRPAKMARYDPATSLDKIEARQVPLASVLKLDWNEGVIAPPASVAAALAALINEHAGALLKWYPHLSGGQALQRELVKYVGGAVLPECLLVTNGSDDALILLCHALLGEGRVALSPVPTYEHFCVNAVVTGARLVRLQMPDAFAADLPTLVAAIEQHSPSVLYLVSPNNPTGVEWPTEYIRTLAARFPATTIIVDEAYIEFGATDPASGLPSSACSVAISTPNVVVTRTFSKAFCLASVRCGYLVAHPSTIEGLLPFYNPKSVNQFAQVAAAQALREYEGYYRPYISALCLARDALLRDLRALGVDARSGGGGNFICIRVTGAAAQGAVPADAPAELCRRLEESSIYVRDISGRFPGYVRVTVGLDMARVVTALCTALRDMGLLAPV